jgi:hypothetical protein
MALLINSASDESSARNGDLKGGGRDIKTEMTPLIKNVDESGTKNCDEYINLVIVITEGSALETASEEFPEMDEFYDCENSLDVEPRPSTIAQCLGKPCELLVCVCVFMGFSLHYLDFMPMGPRILVTIQLAIIFSLFILPALEYILNPHDVKTETAPLINKVDEYGTKNCDEYIGLVIVVPEGSALETASEGFHEMDELHNCKNSSKPRPSTITQCLGKPCEPLVCVCVFMGFSFHYLDFLPMGLRILVTILLAIKVTFSFFWLWLNIPNGITYS